MESEMITNKKRKRKLKMKLTSTNEEESVGEDRISNLPDELIHHILSFSQTKLAVQTSILSKRWKHIWTTLPYFKVHGNNEINFADNFISHRNHAHDIFKFCIFLYQDAPLSLFHKLFNYAISHNVQHLEVEYRNYKDIKLSTLASTSVKTLCLSLSFDEILESDCLWDLPALTTFRLYQSVRIALPQPYLNCLSSLETLYLHNCNLSGCVTLLSLKTLSLAMCNLPAKAWDVPALLSLTLSNVESPKEHTSSFLRGLVNLKKLALYFQTKIMDDWVIDCPQLVNLEINDCLICSTTHLGKILVTSQKIRSFDSKGFFPITFEVSELENVNVEIWDGTDYKTKKPTRKMKKYYAQVTDMFRGLSNARVLTLDLNTIKALSSILDFLVHSPPPFHHLEYVKVPQGYEESSLSPYLKCYLLGNSPRATIVTTLPQKNVIPNAPAQNVVIGEPLAAPTKLLFDSENMHKTVCIDSQDIKEQDVDHVVQNTEVHPDRVRLVDGPFKGPNNDRASSSKENSDLGIWQGHEVNSEFACLLDLILNKYPETFDHFTTTDKKLSTMKLNMLCTSVNVFTKISTSQVDTEMIAEYRDVFAGLQKFGFNVSWLVSRLNYIEHLRFSKPLLSELHAIDCRIISARMNLQDLETLRHEKMQEIQKAFGTMGINVAVGCIGDDLFCAP